MWTLAGGVPVTRDASNDSVNFSVSRAREAGAVSPFIPRDIFTIGRRKSSKFILQQRSLLARYRPDTGPIQEGESAK
jgi:hypothetical protein